MILHCTKQASQSTVARTEFTIPVLGAVTGRRADRISFDAQDFEELLALGPADLWAYLSSLQTRFPAQ